MGPTHFPQYIAIIKKKAMGPLQWCLATIIFFSATHSPILGHPADTDDDNRISIDEVSAYSEAWKGAETWPSGPSPIPDNYQDRAVFIWKTGETYREAPDIAAPFNWVPDPGSGIVFVATETISGEPFDSITLSDIDSDLNLEVSFTLKDRPGTYEASWVPGTEELTIDLQLPLNPFTMDGSGTVLLTIRDVDSSQSWRLPEIELTPLPPAPGATSQLVDKIGGSFSALVANRGYDLNAFSGAIDMGSVPDSIRALVYMNAVLDHPQNSQSMTAQINERLEAEDRDKFDRILAKLNFQQVFDDTVITPESEFEGLNQSDRIRTLSVPPNPMPLAAAACDGNSFLVITSPARLGMAMRQQAAAENATTSKTDTKDQIRDAKKAIDKAIGNIKKARTVGGLFMGQGIAKPKFGFGAGNALSLTLTFADFQDHYNAGTLPSKFDSLEFSTSGQSRGYFVEDTTGCGVATVKVLATVSSKGFNFEETISKLLPKPKIPISPVPGLGPSYKIEIDPAALFQDLKNLFPDSKLMDEEPLTWCNINISSPTFSDVTGDGFLKVEGYNGSKIGMDFKPLKVGTGVLTAEVKGSSFADKTITDDTNYSTNPITVDFINPILLITGEEPSITYKVKLDDADQIAKKDIVWLVSAGTVTNERTDGSGNYEMDWIPSDKNSDYPVDITARSTTSECLRNLEIDGREDTIKVKKDGFSIVPELTCVDAGQQEIFSAVDGSGDSVDVTWSIQSGTGSINPDTGLFTAGTQSEVTIRATPTAPDDEDRWEETTFSVDCQLRSDWLLNLADAPLIPGAGFSPRISIFTLPERGSITARVLGSYDTITPPAEDGLLGTIDGGYYGVGYFQPPNPLLIEILNPQLDANVEYNIPGQAGTYNLRAEIGIDIENPVGGYYDAIELIDGRDGVQFILNLNGGASSASTSMIDVVSWDWTFSDGTVAQGEYVAATFDRDIGYLRAILKITDEHGNIASRYLEIPILELTGNFKMPYLPSYQYSGCLFGEIDSPPALTDGVLLQMTADPTACGLSLFMTGDINGSLSNSSGFTGQLPPETEIDTFAIQSF
ncbi:MAG: hypothetical protein ACI92G_003548 [Candidatus Pelagisphaera sp.]|jgi:hypothetical protein